MTARVLAAAILHETNTFNRAPTTLDHFAGRYLVRGITEARERLTGTGTEIGGILAEADARGWDLVLPVAAACGPSGPLDAAGWRSLRDAVLEAAADGAVDGVVLALHGAMVTEGCHDPEGDLLAALRARLGPDVPIVATLDMHANVTAAMASAADALLAYRTYPHVDQAETARRACDLLARRMAAPEERAATVLVRPPMLDAADHGRTDPPGPMAPLLEAARRLEARPNVWSASIQIGFPWADVAEAGPSVAMSGPTDARAELERAAEDLAQGLWASRHDTALVFPGRAAAMAEAARSGGQGPLVLADFADNPAAGAYGDSPNLLRAMLAAGLSDAAFATLCDPEAVRACHAAGVGARLRLRLGGRHVPDLTPPLAVEGTVARLSDGRFTCDGPMLRGVTLSMGQAACLRVEGVDVVLCSRPTAVTDLALFRSLGIEPRALRTIALKSRNHCRAAFGPIARDVMLVDAGGIASMRLADLPYRHLRRPVWPLDPVEDRKDKEYSR